MPITCGYCGASMPDISEFCPLCGRPVREGNVFAPDRAPAGQEAVAFIFLKQFQERRFVRFHAFQSVFFWAAVVLLGLLGTLASTVGWLFVWLVVGALVALALFFTWVVLSVKALQGEWFELPVLGTLAVQQARR
jgi:uncharacterized membrane protein